MTLVHADFRVQWDRVLPGVRAALEHQKEGLRPEDIYFELRSGKAHLFMGDDGFVILTEILTHTGAKEMLIWLAYSWAQAPVMKQYMPAIDEIAMQARYAAIQFVSTRRGYDRALPQGWDIMHTRWRRRLS